MGGSGIQKKWGRKASVRVFQKCFFCLFFYWQGMAAASKKALPAAWIGYIGRQGPRKMKEQIIK